MNLGAIGSLIVLVIISFVTYHIIRTKSNTSGSDKDTANKWAAWGGGIGAFSAGATWYGQNGLEIAELIYYFFLNMLIFPTTAYVLGRIYSFILSKGKHKSKTNEENTIATIDDFSTTDFKPTVENENPTDSELEAYSRAYDEILSGNMNKSVWAFTYANSTSEEEAKRKYLLTRQRSILNEIESEIQIRDKAEAKRKFELKVFSEKESLRKSEMNIELNNINERSKNYNFIITDLENIGLEINDSFWVKGVQIKFLDGRTIRLDGEGDLVNYYIEEMTAKVMAKYYPVIASDLRKKT